MNDEIREILDRLERIDHKEYSCGFEFADSGSFDEDCRCFEERKKMADYIPNLQKEIYKQISTSIVQKKQINNLQKRNSRQRLANQKQQDLILKLQEDKKKAVEYINNNPFISSIAKVSLLNILQNSRTVNEDYYQVIEGTRSWGKSYTVNLFEKQLEEKNKEIDRLNNVINELEKYIGQEWYCFDNESVEFEIAKNILDKLKELKEE